MSDGNDNGAALGPVDLVVIAYPPDAAATGEAIPLFVDLVDRGIIRVLDVQGIRKDEDGSFSGFDVNAAHEEGVPDLLVFEGAQTGLIGDEDVRMAAEAMEVGTRAVMIVFENTWAAPFVSAVHRNGGRVVAYERVSAQDLLEALELLGDADTVS